MNKSKYAMKAHPHPTPKVKLTEIVWYPDSEKGPYLGTKKHAEVFKDIIERAKESQTA